MSACPACSGRGCELCLDLSPRTTPCRPDCLHPTCIALRRAARESDVAALKERFHHALEAGDHDELWIVFGELCALAQVRA